MAGRAGCVRHDRHAVFLGSPLEGDCPSRLTGHVETVQLVADPLPPHGAGRRNPWGLAVHGGTAVSPDLHVHGAGAGAIVTSGADATLAVAIANSVRLADGPVASSPPTAARPAVAGTGSSAIAARSSFSGRGFDACTAPSASAMNAWLASPYRSVGIYIGGAARACAQPNLTPTWITTVHAQGWQLIPTYVGLQAPCTGFTNRIDPASAGPQGAQSADDAANLMVALGFTADASNPVYFDMEGYNTGDSACVQAVLAFLDAWTVQLQARGFLSGVYGSASSTITNLAQQWANPSFHRPDAIWFANWNLKATVFDDPYVPNHMWSEHQRIHQYQGAHNETHGGVTINIDSNQVEGPTAPGFGSRFTGVTPARVLDSRFGTGGLSTPWSAGQVRDVAVTGLGGVPAGARAVVLNVTVTNPSAGGWLTVWPAGLPRPTASNLNFVSGETIPNLVVVAAGVGGRVSIFNAAGSADVIADVVGYYSAAGSRYRGLTPARVLDSRIGTGGFSSPWAAGGERDLAVRGVAGVSADASAVVLNVTVTNPTSGGYLTVWPSGVARPTASNLNFKPGQTIPNLVVAVIGVDGKVSIFNGTAGATDVIADVVGYYSASEPGSLFSGVTPARVLDSRFGTGGYSSPWPTSGARDVAVAGLAGVPANATAVVLNVTVTNPTSGGYLTVYPAGVIRPTASSLNFGPRQTIANLVIASTGPGAMISIYNATGSVDVIADIVGYYH